MSTNPLIEASIPYKLEPGGVYLIEVKQWAMSRAEAEATTKYFWQTHNIDIQFVFSSGDAFALQAVPAVKAVLKEKDV